MKDSVVVWRAVDDGPDPRLPLLRRLHTMLDADISIAHDVLRPRSRAMRRARRPPQLAHVVLLGRPQDLKPFQHMEGSSLASMEFDLAVTYPIDGVAMLSRDDLAPDLLNALWRPAGIHHAVGCFVTRDGRYLGSASFLRAGDKAPFADDDRRRLLGRLDALRDACEAHRAVRAGTDAIDGTLVCDPDGTTRYHTQGDAPPDALRAPLATLCQRALMAEGPAQAALARTRAQARPLEALEGAGRCVEVRCTPLEPVRVAPAMRLTELKRRIAAFAVQGATVHEIAAAIDRSPETVRTHLKQIYATLGVSSRVELKDACHGVY